MSTLYPLQTLPYIEALLKHQSLTKAAKDRYISALFQPVHKEH